MVNQRVHIQVLSSSQIALLMALIVVTSTSAPVSNSVIFEVAFPLAAVVLLAMPLILLVVRCLATGLAGGCLATRLGSLFDSLAGIVENRCGVLHFESID